MRRGEDQWEVSPAVPLILTAQAIARFTDLLTAPEPDLPRLAATHTDNDDGEIQ